MGFLTLGGRTRGTGVRQTAKAPQSGADVEVLRAALDVLRGRRYLPSADPRRRSGRWLRPNWPNDFVIRAHRKRLARQLIEDSTLRADVRPLLASSAADVVVTCTTAEDLTRELNEAADPDAVFQAVATHEDSEIATAAQPYLLGEAALPPPRSPTESNGAAEKRHDPGAETPTAKDEASRQRELRRLERRAQGAEKAARQLQGELDAVRAQLAEAEAGIANLRKKLPTPKEKKALDRAVALQAELDRVKKALRRAVNERDGELHLAQDELARTQRELASLQTDFEAEQRGRRRLVEELGNASERARRLLTLVKQDSATLTKQAESERPGPTRTRILKRASALEDLADQLKILYLGDDAEPLRIPTTQPQSAGIQGGAVARAQRSLRVTPLGGHNHIGGSAILIEAGTTRILVDAGLRPNAHISRPGPVGISQAIENDLHAVVITHAHADHAGYVPWVLERQRRAKVVCTPQTAALLPTVWADSARVMRAEADAPFRTHQHVEPPYGEPEVMQAEDAVKSLPYGQTLGIGDVEITLFPAGHILGAAGVVIRAGNRRVVLTGDIDDRAQASVGGARIPPKLATHADLLVIETTYCDSVHRDREQEATDLITSAETILNAGGRLLIPAFGLGRAQEIALLVGERMTDVSVLVDGLARDISDLYALNGAPEVFRGKIERVTNRTRAITGFHNGIVITTSGMLTGGAAVPWAKAILEEPRSGLFLCGHQDEESPGKQLEALLDADPSEPREILLRDPETQQPQTISVQSHVMRYNLSAHADRTGLLGIIDEADPDAIMLVHGEPVPQKEFRNRLEALGRRVVSNEETWDSDAPIKDPRRTRWRHSVRHSHRGR